MIKSFKREDAEALFWDASVPRFHAIERQARRRLLYLHRARSLLDLMAPPGNRVEALTGKRQGQHSIRITEQWRIYFRWEEGNAYDGEIAGYQ
jgi:proteic killer suppression protein